MKFVSFLSSLLLTIALTLPAAADENRPRTKPDPKNPAAVLKSLGTILYEGGRSVVEGTREHVHFLQFYGWYAERGASLVKSPLELALENVRPSLYTFEREGRDFGFGFAYEHSGLVYLVGCRHHFLAGSPRPPLTPDSGFPTLDDENAPRTLAEVAPFEAVSLNGERHPATLAAVDEISGLALISLAPEVRLRPLSEHGRLSPLSGPKDSLMVIGKPRPVSPFTVTADSISFRLPGAPPAEPRLAVGSRFYRKKPTAPEPGCRPGAHLLSCLPEEIEYGSLETGLGFGGGPVIDGQSGRLIGVHMVHGAYDVPAGFATPIAELNKLIIKTGFGRVRPTMSAEF